MMMGNLWQLVDRKTRLWMLAGTFSVLAGAVLGIPYVVDVATAGTGNHPPLWAAVVLPVVGGTAVFCTGLIRSRERIRFIRDWSMHPLAGRILWLTGFAMAFASLALLVTDRDGLGQVLGSLSFLVQGISFTVLGWGALLMSTAANYRRFRAGEEQAGVA